ncbi:MAG: glycosyltransferase family 39 protein [bacterium]|nr:glycosyltransferase family 39 protein [bacterium]
MSLLRKHPDFFFGVVLLLLVLGFTLPFIHHAYHIDEPLFLRIAKQIKSDPLDPYGFYYLWNLYYKPISQIAAFPPLFAYYLALISINYFYPPEWLIHLSLIPFAMIAVLAFYSLSRQFNLTPTKSFLASSLFAVSPAFVVSSNMAMPDVACVAMVLLAFVFSVQGWKSHKTYFLVLGGLSLAIATLFRYNAVPLIGILFLLGLTFQNWKRAIIPSLIATGFFSVWLLWSSFLTGASHTSETLSIFMDTNGIIRRFWTLNTHLTLSTFIPFLVAIFWWKKGLFWRIFILFLMVDVGFLLTRGQIKQFALFPDLIFFGLGLATLFFLAYLFLKNLKSAKVIQIQNKNDKNYYASTIQLGRLTILKNNQDFQTLTLVLWITSVLLIPIIYVQFASKYLLLAQPPLILLLFLYFKRRWLTYTVTAFLPIMLTLSLLVAQSDFGYANIYRETAEKLFNDVSDPNFIEKKSPYPRIWFTGHWGWQYYLESYGAKPLPYVPLENTGALVGDLILTSKLASSHKIHPTVTPLLKRKGYLFPQKDVLFRTMNDQGRAGFYSDSWGPLPFTVSNAPLERFAVYEIE